MRTNFGFDRNPYRWDVNFNDYYWFKDGFTLQELQTIEGMTKQIEFQDAVTGEGQQSKKSDYRKSRIKWCPQNQEWGWVYKKLHDMIAESNNKMWKFDLSTMNEQIQYTEYYGTVNLNNLLKFVNLRTHEGAQWEIQRVAEAVLEIATDLWPVAVNSYRKIRGGT